MEITRQADYAVRTVLYLAQQPSDTRVATGHIARAQRIPPSFLAKIVLQLSAAGIVHTTRGVHGGVILAKSADTISLLEVVEAVDGPITFNACVLEPARCTRSPECVLRPIWTESRADLVRRLAAIKLGKLLNGGQPKP